MMAASASDVALQRDRLDDAAPLVEEALRTGRAAMPGDTRLGNVLSRTSRFWLATGDRPRAIDQLDEACRIASDQQAWAYLAVHLANLCEALVDDGRGVEAEARHRGFHGVPDDAVDASIVHLAAFSGAAVEEQFGRLGAAIGQARLAAATADRGSDLADRREARFQLARMLASAGATAPALAMAEEAATLVPDDWPHVLLSLVVARAAARRVDDPGGARDALAAALRRPFADRILHPALDAARIELARCHVALGDPAAARAAVAGVNASVAAEVAAVAVRLDAARVAGEPVAAPDLADAQAWIEGDRVRPTAALELMRALLPHLPKRGHARHRARMAGLAQRLADSLRDEPPLQAAFIRRHRDLLT